MMISDVNEMEDLIKNNFLQSEVRKQEFFKNNPVQNTLREQVQRLQKEVIELQNFKNQQLQANDKDSND